MNQHNDQTVKRKDEHISICLEQPVQGQGITTGLEKWKFKHLSLPEINFSDIDLSTTLFGKQVATPLLISSMTGGTEQANRINHTLAAAAEQRGWSLGLGSMRVAIEHPELAYSFQLRSYAPTIPIIANLGLVSLNYGIGIEQCRQVVALAEADALVFHMNSLQEVFQPEGDTNFAGLLRKLEAVIARLEVPVGVKEVGWGIDAEVRDRMLAIGVQFIDVAGAGGTSWSQVEHYRTHSAIQRAAATSFADWGIPTADCLLELRDGMQQHTLIGSGGLHTGIDAAKVLALGADAAGFGRTLLSHAVAAEDGQAINERLATIEYELKAAMFGIGARTIAQLQRNQRLIAH